LNIKPRLISFKLCPFVQRAVITLKEKSIDYDIEYIDLAAPPVDTLPFQSCQVSCGSRKSTQQIKPRSFQLILHVSDFA
jgi:hypothetical protein